MASRRWRAAGLLLLQLQLLSSASLFPSLAAAAGPAAARVASTASDDVVFSSGTVPTDSGGQPVSAHEGWLMTNEDSYLWYGSGQKQNVTDGSSWDWLSDSILLYTSHDLSSWKKRATVFTADQVPAAVRARLLRGSGSSSGSSGPLRLERPKVLYNTARRYYVLIFSLGSLDRSVAEVGWAVSVSPFGPFKFDASRQPDGLPSWDLTVASEGDTDAWLARSVPGTGIAISKLDADFLDSTGRCALLPPPASAAPSAWQQRLGAAWSAAYWLTSAHSSQNILQALPAAANAATAAEADDRQQAILRVAARAVATMRSLFGVGQRRGNSDSREAGFPNQAVASKGGGSDAGAPCLFRFRGRWYLLAARKTAWAPSKVVLYVNDGSSPCDEASWRQLPAPAQGPGGAHAFDSTPAFVYAHQFTGTDQVLLVYFGDRWHPSDPQGPAAASYVWLPLVPAPEGQPADSLQLLNLNSWRLGDFRPPSHLQES